MRFGARFLAVVASVITTAAGAGPAAAESPAAPTQPPAATPVAPPTLTPDQAQAAATEARIVVVHLATHKRVRLDRRTSETAPWVEVCWAPCDTRTWADATYRVVGEDLLPSGEFTLPPARDGRVALRVHAGSQVKRNLGFGLLGGGVVLGVVGGIVTGLGASATKTVDGVTRDGNHDVLTAGTILLLTGVATAIGGGTFIAQNWASSVAPPHAAEAPEAPATHGALPASPAATGVAISLPLLGGRF